MVSGIKSIDKLKSVLSDKYEIVGLIAAGGMGEIYLGIHKVLGKKRAIKIIKAISNTFKKPFFLNEPFIT